MTDALVSFRQLPIKVSKMTLHRWRAKGQFPAPDTINSRLYWKSSDIQAWRAGKRSNWPPDAGTADRRAELVKRMHGRTRWSARGSA